MKALLLLVLVLATLSAPAWAGQREDDRVQAPVRSDWIQAP